MLKEQLLMGNEAIGLGALHAGVGFVAGYPGTPSTEILETVAKHKGKGVYVEWSVNEKAALEAAAGAAYAGVRSMVTMKQVGLNVASDPLMSLTYVGIKSGMVVVVADDPGPISSQTEQDTRRFAEFAKLPVFDPSSPEEAYQMIGDAFALSEQLGTPVLLRPTTRICHGCVSLPIEECPVGPVAAGFVKDTSRWVIFPKLTYQNHQKIEARNEKLRETFSTYRLNRLEGSGKKGIAAGGVSYAYTKEALQLLEKEPRLLKISTPHPFPETLALSFLDGLEEVLVLEELDPVIERELTYLCGKHHLNVTIKGKLTGDVPNAGELSVEIVKERIERYLGLISSMPVSLPDIPSLPVRPPVLCAGCPHRASFYAVKQAMKGKKAVFSGDIGCYTLGNAAPLDMVDTCLCMGAGITIAQGLHRVEPDAVNFAFVGDSTFFASGLTGVVNAVYNDADIVLIVLDNSTTAMTGHQPHPGTGKTMMGEFTQKVSIPKMLEAAGVSFIRRVNPLDLVSAIQAVQEAASVRGVSAVIFESPCVALIKPETVHMVDPQACIGCSRCVRELGCPALTMENKKAKIEPDMCYGCTLCAQVCPVDAIRKEEKRA